MENKTIQNNKKNIVSLPISVFSAQKTTTGFSLIEILIAIAILLIIGGVSISPFLNWRREKAIDSASDITLSVLEEARNLTINAYKGNQYGVYLGTNDRLITFIGTTYDSGTTSNIVTMLPTNEIISTSTLGTSVVFQKFSGSAQGNGIIVLSDKNNASTTRTIIVDISGAVSQKK